MVRETGSATSAWDTVGSEHIIQNWLVVRMPMAIYFEGLSLSMETGVWCFTYEYDDTLFREWFSEGRALFPPSGFDASGRVNVR